jgi:polyisoprenoid-binding protein YceI
MASSPPPKKRSWLRWLIGGIVVVLVLVVGGPFVYIHFIEGPAPAPLSLSTTTTPTTIAKPGAAGSGTTAATDKSGSLDGVWKVGSGSTAGYRVKEDLFGQHAEAVGRTTSVTGSMTIAGTQVTKGSFTVDMTSVTSDRSQRDGQFQGRIMDTATYPTSSFVLTAPIQLAPVPNDGVIKKYQATGKLTLHGTTNSVTFPLNAKRSGSVIQVQGIVPITFADYNIDNPSGGPASVGNSGQMEFLLQLQQS